MLARRSVLALPLAAFAQTSESGFTPLLNWQSVEAPESAFTVAGSEIAVHSHASLPAWLRSEKCYENFDLQGEFFIAGWTDSGIYIHAPEHGRPSQAGLQIKVFHQPETEPHSNSAGAIFPDIAPRLVNVAKGWNSFRVLADYPRLQVWFNNALIHDLNCATHPALKDRLRSGYIGIVGASSECRFRNLRIRELPGKDKWQVLYEKPEDLAANWHVTQGKPNVIALGNVLRGDGGGLLATNDKFQDFHFQCYVRGSAQHNSGIIFRSAGKGTDPRFGYEIQLHPVEEAHYPTGSLYHFKRARYPRIQDEKWFLFDLIVQGRDVTVRVDGDTIMEYSGLPRTEAGFIELQTHREGFWIEFKHLRVQKL
ncbi:MAG: DUF1080 domain-containing protein [Acidobacteria bacterium]|nr:DUF1080 domain-containing protein [Acidobacteriota bacterium]